MFSFYRHRLDTSFHLRCLQDDTLNADKKGTTDFINDRDLTFVGNVLRKYYLDELPQLVNIIKGEMSFIGPRPVPEDQYISTLEQGYQAKRVLRAGLTDLFKLLRDIEEISDLIWPSTTTLLVCITIAQRLRYCSSI